MAKERQVPTREVPVRIIYRKRRQGHGHHGGAWKVAFADFMTSMFALFLALLGAGLGARPNPVRIEGYTDARPYPGGSTYTNWELSADRANAARRILTESGLALSQVIQIRGFADCDLRDPAHPFAAANRRVTITMLMDDPRKRHAAEDSLAT